MEENAKNETLNFSLKIFLSKKNNIYNKGRIRVLPKFDIDSHKKVSSGNYRFG